MSLDINVKDKRMLTELEMNARISHSELAKKVGLSKQVTKYRVERLEKNNIIQQYHAIIDIAKLGETVNVIYFKFQHLKTIEEDKWIKKIDAHPRVMAVGKNGGHLDLTIIIQSIDNEELDEILKEITMDKKDKILEMLITSEIESNYFNLKLLNNKETIESIIKGRSNIIIDELDKLLIKELAINCRQSLIELSQKIKLSPNGVKERIKNLEKKGIIAGYKTKVNYEKLGYLHHRVFLHLKRMDKELYAKFREFLKKSGVVESMSRYIGYADLDFRCHVKSVRELYELISSIKNVFVNEVIFVDSVIIFDWERINYYSKK